MQPAPLLNFFVRRHSATTGTLAIPKSQRRLNEVLLQVVLHAPPTGLGWEPAQRCERQVKAMNLLLILSLVAGTTL